MAFVPPVAGAPPVAFVPPVAGAPPAAGAPPVAFVPPIALVPPVADEALVPPVADDVLPLALVPPDPADLPPVDTLLVFDRVPPCAGMPPLAVVPLPVMPPLALPPFAVVVVFARLLPLVLLLDVLPPSLKVPGNGETAWLSQASTPRLASNAKVETARKRIGNSCTLTIVVGETTPVWCHSSVGTAYIFAESLARASAAANPPACSILS